jgi:hypothetical protein
MLRQLMKQCKIVRASQAAAVDRQQQLAVDSGRSQTAHASSALDPPELHVRVARAIDAALPRTSADSRRSN